MDNGVDRGDRTGTGTRSVFAHQMRFDLSEGFPAVTTKKLAFKAVKSELLWFLEGSGDERRLAEINGTERTIWTANAEADYWKPKAKFEGDLQKVYGYQWRKWSKYDSWRDSVTLIEQGTKIGDDQPFSLDFDLEQVDYTGGDDFVGKIFDTNQSGQIKILKKLDVRNGNSYYRVQFLEGINTIIDCSRPNIRSKTVKNPYAMTAAEGAGCYGVVDKRSKYLTSAYNMWLNMMERCHGENTEKTLFYKQQGIYVDSKWRCFSNFYRDIHGLVGFDKWVINHSKYELDKDYFGNKFYGIESTIFLPMWYNQYILPKHNNDLIIATNKKSNEEFKFTTPSLFYKQKDIKDTDMVNRAFREQNGNSINWSFSKKSPPIGYKWRQQFFVDQIADVIESIKNDPDSRRHIVTAYNPGELQDMALPPCHMIFQFYVANGKLSCHMNQRSCDLFLGVPFNIASYALLTHMIAQVCGLDVGELILTLGDAHIYSNHFDQVNEQLSREPQDLPTLWLNPDIKDIDSFTMDDIKLENYNPQDTIKAKMAV